ncbi:uncharacterized protein PAE49_009674 [Odontesthes bonariensis]|uniref:uncharacterized protein LOC142388092 n=1 Tax=Odontesthes bonariensis TaxID=219752 RepID=UPI003F58790E
MLTGWLTLTAILVGSANPGNAASGSGALTMAPSCRVKGQPEAELTLNCGDGKRTGVVQYWHTPFGELQVPGFHAGLDPVFMRHDGSLVIPNSSLLHSGLYYCLLQHTGGAALWQYELHVGPNHQNSQEHGKYEQANRCAALRVRRNAASAEERQAGVSDGLFAGAVAASVLLTFVVGFSAGALSRTHVLRCLGAVTMRLQSLQRRPRPADTPDHSSQVTMTTMSPTYTNRALETEEKRKDDSANYATLERVLTTPSPPAKPKRSFRHKREEEGTAYLERGDYTEEERKDGEDVAQRGVEGGNGERKEEEERETSVFYLLEDKVSQTETDEDKRSEDRIDLSLEEEESAGVQEIRNKDGGDDAEQKLEEVKEKLEESSTETEEEEGSSKNEDTMSKDISEEPSSPAPRRGRRVIRLYQYDEDGQRFCHLPDATPEASGPAPRCKQRSLSLTRLSAIMAAASAGPLERRETGGEERPHFHMEI